MAEGWTRQLGNSLVEVQSAGIEAHGKNPYAIAVMKESGINISGQESTVISDEMVQDADVIVTVCGHADEQCPTLPSGMEKVHWPLVDPANAVGTEMEIMDQYRATRDEVETRVRGLLAKLTQGDEL
jgi:arsenate reductase